MSAGRGVVTALTTDGIADLVDQTWKVRIPARDARAVAVSEGGDLLALSSATGLQLVDHAGRQLASTPTGWPLMVASSTHCVVGIDRSVGVLRRTGSGFDVVEAIEDVRYPASVSAVPGSLDRIAIAWSDNPLRGYAGVLAIHKFPNLETIGHCTIDRKTVIGPWMDRLVVAGGIAVPDVALIRVGSAGPTVDAAVTSLTRDGAKPFDKRGAIGAGALTGGTLILAGDLLEVWDLDGMSVRAVGLLDGERRRDDRASYSHSGRAYSVVASDDTAWTLHADGSVRRWTLD